MVRFVDNFDNDGFAGVTLILIDYQRMQIEECLGGPGISIITPPCLDEFDADNDDDLDLADMAVFQNRFISEAIYVSELTLGAGSTVTIDNCTVYYDVLIDDGAVVDFVGQAALCDLNGVCRNE